MPTPMTEKQRKCIRQSIEKEAEEKQWSWFCVKVTALETGKSEPLRVPGHDAHHASRSSAMLLLEMPLRGETIEYNVKPIEPVQS